MAEATDLGPTDVAAALIHNNNLVILDGRAQTWTFNPKAKNAAGEAIEGPEGAKEAVVIGGRLHVLDGSGVLWTYNPPEGWVEGFEMDDKIENEGEGDKDKAWIKGRSVDSRAAYPEELRQAKAVVAAAEARQEAEGTSGKSKTKSKAKEPAY